MPAPADAGAGLGRWATTMGALYTGRGPVCGITTRRTGGAVAAARLAVAAARRRERRSPTQSDAGAARSVLRLQRAGCCLDHGSAAAAGGSGLRLYRRGYGRQPMLGWSRGRLDDREQVLPRALLGSGFGTCGCGIATGGLTTTATAEARPTTAGRCSSSARGSLGHHRTGRRTRGNRRAAAAQRRSAAPGAAGAQSCAVPARGRSCSGRRGHGATGAAGSGRAGNCAGAAGRGRHMALPRLCFLFLLLGQDGLHHVAGLGDMREINLGRDALCGRAKTQRLPWLAERVRAQSAREPFGLVLLQTNWSGSCRRPGRAPPIRQESDGS